MQVPPPPLFTLELATVGRSGGCILTPSPSSILQSCTMAAAAAAAAAVHRERPNRSFSFFLHILGLGVYVYNSIFQSSLLHKNVPPPRSLLADNERRTLLPICGGGFFCRKRGQKCMRNKCAIHSFACTLTVRRRRSDFPRFLQATLLPRITRQFDKGVLSSKEF